jgi:hypothetical protein
MQQVSVMSSVKCNANRTSQLNVFAPLFQVRSSIYSSYSYCSKIYLYSSQAFLRSLVTEGYLIFYYVVVINWPDFWCCSVHGTVRCKQQTSRWALGYIFYFYEVLSTKMCCLVELTCTSEPEVGNCDRIRWCTVVLYCEQNSLCRNSHTIPRIEPPSLQQR